MPMVRRLLGLASLVGFVLALASFVRRGGGRRRERVDLYYDDGSMVSLPDGSPESARLLSLGRDALRAARTA
jgi:hypothetical protein